MSRLRTRVKIPLLCSGRLIFWVILAQMISSLMLLPEAGISRSVLRTCAFAATLAALVLLLPRRSLSRHHPAAGPALLSLAIVAIGTFSLSPNLTAGTAQFVLYTAVLSPLFWVPKLRISSGDITKVIVLMFCYHITSTSLGLLQMRYPWLQPAVSEILDKRALQIELADGSTVYRPMGLTDLPGGASQSAFLTVLLAIGIVISQRRLLLRAIAAASLFAGFTCLCLAQVRILVVITVIVVLSIILILAVRQRTKTMMIVLAASSIIAVGGFFYALDVGGNSVTSRLSTLISDSPGKVYASNRGSFLSRTYEEIFDKYPLGAGPGRWGMMSHYFGRPADGIWAEIQWTGWMLDGGIPLVLSYTAALALAIFFSLRRTLSPRTPANASLWGSVLLAYNIAFLASTFGSCPFISQSGIDFWIFNSMFYAYFHPIDTLRAPELRDDGIDEEVYDGLEEDELEEFPGEENVDLP